MIKTLFFADAHVEPGQDLSRADALGNFIVHHQPDNIVDLGDTFSLSSISGWDLSKKLTMTGRQYSKDVVCAVDWTERLFGPINAYNEKQRQNKAKLYRPHKVRMKGNHEHREERYIEQNPELAGHLDIDRLSGYASNFDVSVPYKGRYFLNGINIMHCPLAGNDQPISGLHIPYKTLQRFVNHTVTGHYHRYEEASAKRTDCENIQKAIICPAFFDGQPTYLSPNAPAAINRGIILITQDEDTLVPEVEEISLTRLYKEYM